MKVFVNRVRSRLGQLDNEDGFTLVELMIVVVIIGVLIAVAVPVYGAQQRAAVDATVQHDVKSNSVVMAPGEGRNAFMGKGKFLDSAAETDANITDYFVKADFTEACTETRREYSTDDVTYWHFLSTVGYIEKGPCPPFDDVPPVDTPDPGEEPSPSPTPTDPNVTPEVDDVPQHGGLLFRTEYEPQTNHLTFCYRLWVTIDPDYPHNTENPSVSWEYTLDINQGPFWGLNPLTDLHSEFGYETKSLGDGIWVIRGEGWNDNVTYDEPIFAGFCSSSVPVPPLDTSIYEYSVETVPSANNWWACIQFKITTDSIYPRPWTIRVDLSDYFRSLNIEQGRAPTFELFRATRVGTTGYVYDLEGIGWNDYVADYPGYQRDVGNHRVCYGPQGHPF